MKLACTCTILAALALVTSPLAAADLKVGDKAPSFSLKDDSGKEWNSADHVGKKIVVVYFYPAAMTGGCTKQACGFRDDMKKLANKDVEVVGVSGDQPAGLALFKKVYDLNFELLSDPDGSVAKKFGVPVSVGEKQISREVDGKEHVLKRGATANRWTFIIGKDGNITLKNTKVNAAADSKAILKAVSSSN